MARYGRVQTVQAAVIDCLWYGTFGPLPVRMVCVRDRDDPKAPMLALVTTDLTATVADLIARYAMRWSIEVAFFDCRQTLGVGQARNRIAQAVERTFAFGMYVYSLSCIWYAISGHRARGRHRASHRRTVVSVQDRPVVRRHAHRPTTHHHRHTFYARSPSSTHPRGNPSGPARMGTRSRINHESRENQEGTPNRTHPRRRLPDHGRSVNPRQKRRNGLELSGPHWKFFGG